MTISHQPSAISHGGEGIFAWWRDADQRARHAFVAAALGWMLDSFDVMLYSMVLAALIEDPQLHLTLSAAGILNSVTLVSAAAGGIAFGVIADRIGRKRALMAAVLIYSVFTAACGFAQSAVQLAVFRILLGLGMGGEWATGAALVSESFPARHRGKVPLRDGEGASRSRQIQRLHDELQRAVEREEFEHAAAVRDEIRRLEAETGATARPEAGA